MSSPPAMFNWPLDADGDIDLINSTGALLSGLDAFAQAVRTKINLFLGEWWLDLTDGTPVFQRMLGTSDSAANNIQAIDSLLSDRIMAVPNAVSIAWFQSSIVNRAYKYTVLVNSAFGQVAISSTPFKSGAGGN